MGVKKQDLMSTILSNPLAPEWIKAAAEAAMRREPLTAANEARLLANAVLEWDMQKVKR